MAGLYAPLPTLRPRPRGRRRTARGRCGSLLLHRSGLPPPTPCRSPGAPDPFSSFAFICESGKSIETLERHFFDTNAFSKASIDNYIYVNKHNRALILARFCFLNCCIRKHIRRYNNSRVCISFQSSEPLNLLRPNLLCTPMLCRNNSLAIYQPTFVVTFSVFTTISGPLRNLNSRESKSI